MAQNPTLQDEESDQEDWYDSDENDEQDRDIQRLRGQMHTLGFNEALEFDHTRDDEHMQRGFEEGFSRTIPLWFRAGQMRGVVDAMRVLSSCNFDFDSHLNPKLSTGDTTVDKFVEQWRQAAVAEEVAEDSDAILEKLEEDFESSIVANSAVDAFVRHALQVDRGVREVEEEMRRGSQEVFNKVEK